ncbi:pseudouridine synthase [Paragemmobacter straminiformis]|uniref:Pseudouridine synthase n=1 Tax=Paragemmobacter straminiformis TaxID=2045119 RepID=A0A842IBR5_9RHOB|nr:pseudouridine synthase [Gemmobacter straminiformis]MBC2837019.1 pseudouridine synthase [Gemmobacter straminiformis]
MTKAPTRSAAPAETPEGDRIAKVLSRAGIASRREAERMIAAGEVAVNGKVIDSPALNVGPKDRITVRGEAVGQPEPARLWLYYKPEGLVTSASDEKGRETVFDHLPEDMPRVMSVGRLDLNSEGLLLLTNDGELKRRLELPSTGWLRKYRVRVKGNPTDPDLEPLRRGITVEGEKFQPMSVVLDRHQGANAWLTIGLREGRNREIRRAINEIGLIVNRLIRISYGPFRLNELQPGEVEEIRPRILRDQLGLTGEASDDFAPKPEPRAPRPAGNLGGKTGGKAGGKPPSKPRSFESSDPAKRARPAPKAGDKFAPRTHAKAGPKPRPDDAAPARPRSFSTAAKADATPRTDGPAKPRGFSTAKPAAKPAAQPPRESTPRGAPSAKPRSAAKPAGGPRPAPNGPARGAPKGGPRKPSNR